MTHHRASESEIRHVAGEALGEYHSHQRIGGFLDRSEVYVLNGGAAVLKLFFHFGEKKWSREVAAYRFLARHPLPIARLIACGHTPSDVPWVVLERLPGNVLDHLQHNAATRPAVAELMPAIGTLARELHHIDMTSEPARMELTPYLSERARKYAGHAAAILKSGVPHRQLWELACERMTNLARQFDRGEQLGRTTFIHGDFCFRNILARRDDQRWRVSGLIDFEKASLAADPLEDIGRMLLYSVYWNREHVRALCQAYCLSEAVRTVERLEFHLLGFGLEVATWAHDQDPRHFDEVSRIVGDLVAKPGAWLPRTHVGTDPHTHP